jgi:hypothetical protein
MRFNHPHADWASYQPIGHLSQSPSPSSPKPECSMLDQTSLQHFIALVFKQHYGADVQTFCKHLLGVPKPNTPENSQQWQAAAGYNLAEDGPLFLEQYLNQTSIEKHLASHHSLAIERHTLAEVGNLAATQAGATRALIGLMTQTLYALGRRWVVFTATQSLINSFHRMGLQPVILTPALPNKVTNAAAWGSYYQHKPYVVLGDITQGYAQLFAQNRLQSL